MTKAKSKYFNQKGRYQPNSVKNHDAVWVGDRRQALTRRGDDWTDDDIHALLEAWLVHELCFTHTDSEHPTLQGLLRRSWDGWKSALWKRAVNYKRDGQAVGLLERYAFDPAKRTDRSGQPWTQREYALLHRAYGPKGLMWGATDPALLAKLFARQQFEVQRKLEDVAKKADIHGPNLPKGLLSQQLATPAVLRPLTPEQKAEKLRVILKKLAGAALELLKELK